MYQQQAYNQYGGQYAQQQQQPPPQYGAPSQQQQQQQQYGYQQQAQATQQQAAHQPQQQHHLVSQQQQAVPEPVSEDPALATAADESKPQPIYIDTQHDDMVHDAKLDYYGTKLATGSSDRTIKVYDVSGNTC